MDALFFQEARDLKAPKGWRVFPYIFCLTTFSLFGELKFLELSLKYFSMSL